VVLDRNLGHVERDWAISRLLGTPRHQTEDFHFPTSEG